MRAEVKVFTEKKPSEQGVNEMQWQEDIDMVKMDKDIDLISVDGDMIKDETTNNGDADQAAGQKIETSRKVSDGALSKRLY